MKRTIIVAMLISACLIPGTSLGMMNKVGTAGAIPLKIGVDARVAGMGGACGAIVGSAANSFTNPAGLACVTRREAFMYDTEWIADVRLLGGAYAFPYSPWGVLAVSVLSVDYGQMPMLTEAQADAIIGSFSPRDLVVGFSYAKQWTDRLMVGGTVKYIDQTIADYHSSGVAFDFGTVYRTGFRSLRLAMSTNNFGPDMKFGGSYMDKYYIGTAYVETEKGFGTYDLPLNFRIALAYDFDLGSGSKLTTALDATHPNDYSERLHLGAEYSWNEMFFLRAGYTANAGEMGPSMGCGFKVTTRMGKGSFDYAYTEFGVFRGVHRFGFGLTF